MDDVVMNTKVLVYISSATRVPHREGGTRDIGVFLGELVEPLAPLYKAGCTIEFVSPDGKSCTIDKESYNLLYWGFSKRRLAHAKEFLKTLKHIGLDAPMKLADLLADTKKLDSYDVLFVPGGHAPMTDILFENWLESETLNVETGALLRHFHDAGKTTALICHAPSALAAAPEEDGVWLYDGYKMTCVSMLSEWLIEDSPFSRAGGHLPDYPVKLLKRKGAHIKNTLPGFSLVVEDRELITGQDPFAARALGRRLLQKMGNCTG